MKNIILASQSPRRKEILTMMGLKDFETIPSDFYEELDDSRSPEEVAEELGLGKALLVARQNPHAIVIGSDTIVTIDNRQLAKAESIEQAREMLSAAAKLPNKVTTSLAVVCLDENINIVCSENSWVHFKPYDSELVEAYLATGDYADKAGAYGIQSGAAPLIEYIEGNFDAIVGLPSHLLAPILIELGYPVHAIDYPVPPELQLSK